ncbi:hypothetical protein OU798_18485 [Prolixibacteraceae bacterium Z1-6]|uniref:Uncharacterized protein n=1 Tax=Draconibacterium aestuarii TaxID=2998507 RepID=A0A9X3F8A4_9BACT|nr:hypothetical protein [Prolixibacteraceae bacterium Z1-6]
MKTTMKQVAAATIIAILVLAGNVKADGTEVKGSGHRCIETTLQLENWMTDETIWNTLSIEMNEFTTEAEMDLEIENWMTNNECWNVNSSLTEETEPEMTLEDWMTNEKIWNTPRISYESELELEAWMINDEYWN